ncbi:MULTISPECIES: DNA polymerase III subunit gamma/tau [Eubacterium]|uniref:DNA-directed DNA polymerase n=1 Tax=Eubacterium ruminantium TaxID=42322 RepID=A0A1T4KEM4_9FIRM|nr:MULTISPECIES: DNA polymerase III subunit gamma/tau [Eubacterium]MCR5368730.1 DNA polymerase III subunit gamma/tau [Eubacterium sp.]SCW31315.1 DNA polymerase-3 subunit gamma/tau [Eubacterium ruminantium]SDM25378.1 DNA polymerase-3 subunit gamma/tau [Eubacterium ruminantium]SJZ40860.1 DNA polymerase-3 subunit gamma/tau [Eubacterium ruminantium]
MSYTALYRKWRPDSFEEVKGQEHIVKTLKNEVIHNRIGHAYLFCGTRGTGKTSIAKLFAKTVNCEHPVDGSPCGECESCKAIARGNSFNVIEIDAASNNGVDNIRQITEAVQYAPSQGKYLVYIIDEVHMLSAGAFNALLKTLEEPPEYVIFILATTEARKVPVTIMSRCQRYDFHRISIETITARLAELMEREGIKATDEALRYVARAADGSMRDALSILDQCISFNLGEELTFEKVLNSIGAVDVDIFIRMTETIIKDDINSLMDIVNEVVWQGRDLTQFVSDYIWFIRNMLFLKISPGVRSNLDITEETAERLVELGKDFSTDALMRYLDILGELLQEIRISTIKRITLEIALIRMVRPEMQSDISAVTGRVERLEKIVSGEGGSSSSEGTGSQSSGGAGISEEAVRKLIREELAKGNYSDSSGTGSAGDGPVRRNSDIDMNEVRKSYNEASVDVLQDVVNNWDSIVNRIPKVYQPFAKKLKIRLYGDKLVVDNDWSEYEDAHSQKFFISHIKEITNGIADIYKRKIVFYIRNNYNDGSDSKQGKSVKTKGKVDFPIDQA